MKTINKIRKIKFNQLQKTNEGAMIKNKLLHNSKSVLLLVQIYY